MGPSRPGLLSALTAAFRDMGLEVQRADINSRNGMVDDTFFVTDGEGRKVTDASLLASMEAKLADLGQAPRQLKPRPEAPEDPTGTIVDPRPKQEALYSLMDAYIKNDVLSIQQSIANHVEYTLARSRYKFDDEDAYRATAHSGEGVGWVGGLGGE